jgi:hypothetical protein
VLIFENATDPPKIAMILMMPSRLSKYAAAPDNKFGSSGAQLYSGAAVPQVSELLISIFGRIPHNYFSGR